MTDIRRDNALSLLWPGSKLQRGKIPFSKHISTLHTSEADGEICDKYFPFLDVSSWFQHQIAAKTMKTFHYYACIYYLFKSLLILRREFSVKLTITKQHKHPLHETRNWMCHISDRPEITHQIWKLQIKYMNCPFHKWQINVSKIWTPGIQFGSWTKRSMAKRQAAASTSDWCVKSSPITGENTHNKWKKPSDESDFSFNTN